MLTNMYLSIYIYLLFQIVNLKNQKIDIEIYIYFILPGLSKSDILNSKLIFECETRKYKFENGYEADKVLMKSDENPCIRNQFSMGCF